jgi:hypothetical protein
VLKVSFVVYGAGYPVVEVCVLLCPWGLVKDSGGEFPCVHGGLEFPFGEVNEVVCVVGFGDVVDVYVEGGDGVCVFESGVAWVNVGGESVALGVAHSCGCEGVDRSCGCRGGCVGRVFLCFFGFRWCCR